METDETITAAQMFADVLPEIMRLRMVGYSFDQVAELLGRVGLIFTAGEVADLYLNAMAEKALTYPNGRVEVQIFGGGKSIKYFTDPDYPQGTVMVWPNGRQWLLVRNTPPHELPRLPRARSKRCDSA